MKPQILIGTNNPYKMKKLSKLVSMEFEPIETGLLTVEERGRTFLKIAENKAIDYSRMMNYPVICTDGGAVIPALPKWNPIKTRRFEECDAKRIKRVLSMMEGIEDRRVEWHEAIAVAFLGKVIFSCQARAMDGEIAKSFTFDAKHYKPGIWLCSITNFPQFKNKNYFDLNAKERKQTEDSWDELEKKFKTFLRERKQL